MEKNTITATIPFSFKGKEHTPTSIIDLDVYTRANQDFNFLFHLVATESNIDRFSYEYEVLESSPILFTSPTGLATEFLTDDQFDLDGFIAKRKVYEVQERLQEIASQEVASELKRANLEKNDAIHKAINQALLKAYQAGRDSIRNENA